MNTNDLAPTKSFWEKPQGTPGMIGIALLAVGAGYLVLSNAAWLAAAMANLTTAVFMGIGLFSLVWLLSDKKVRNLIWYFYKIGIEKLTNIFIDIYPIEIAKAYISELKTKRQKMSQQLTKLKSEIGVLKRKIKDTNEQIKEAMKLASVAKGRTSEENGDRYQAQSLLHARKAGRRQNSAIKLTDLLKTLNKMYKRMEKMHYYSGIMIEDTADEVDLLESERKAIHAGHSVMKAAQAIMAGDSDEKDMFDRAMQRVADDIGGKLGEMDRFMDLSENFINGVDLENGVFELDGLSMLEEWEKGDTMKFLDQGPIKYSQVTSLPEGELIEAHNNNYNSNSKTKFFD